MQQNNMNTALKVKVKYMTHHFTICNTTYDDIQTLKSLNYFNLHCLLCPNKFSGRDKVSSNPTAMSHKNL